MSESIGEHNADQAMQESQPMRHADGVSAGALLRQARESAGMYIDVLAGVLKVPVARLQALEADDYAAFPDAVFMRALASSICRVLKADAAPVLALLPQGAPIQLPPDRAINTSFKDSGRRSGKAIGSLDQPKSRVMAVAVGALLLGALAVAFLPLDMGTGNENQAEVSTTPAAPAPAAEPVAAQEYDTAPAMVLPGAAPVAQAQQAESTPVVQDTAVAAAVPVDGVLVIRALKESWVQVRNADGRVVLQKALTAGESYTAEGNPPWRVVIGRADAIEVVVRGQAMDLKAVSRENVARFEVK